MNIFEIVCMVIAAAAALAAVITWLQNGRKSAVESTKEEAAQDKESVVAQVKLEATLEYIKDGVDDIKLEQKAQGKEIDKTKDRLARIEEHIKNQDERLDRLEGKQ